VAGPLRFEVDGVIGDLEEHVAKQNLDFFHVPSALLALLRLKRRTARPVESMLCPDASAAALGQLTIAQLDTAMPARRHLLHRASWLRRCDVFTPLSVAEAAMLCTLMEPVRRHHNPQECSS
jgi:hypothetical protein